MQLHPIHHDVGVQRPRLLRIVCPAYPAFNIYSHQARMMTPLGPVYVGTAAKSVPGWDVEIIDENNYRSPLTAMDGRPDHEMLQRRRPADAVGFYAGLTSTIPRLYELARRYKQMGVPTIAGGQHLVEDTIPDALNHDIDIVVREEGEDAIRELLMSINEERDVRSIPGIAYLVDGATHYTDDQSPIGDLDALPIPDFSIVRDARLKYFSISGARGCAMKCEFCSVRGTPRFISPERLVEQFSSAHERWGARTFFVTDDLFGQNRPETLRFCELLREYQQRAGTRFSITVQIRLDRARDAELLSAMRRAGIRVLAIGYESPIPEELRAMKKGLKPEEMVELTKIYHRNGFRVHGMFIFGYPMRPGATFRIGTAERVKHFTRFIRRARIDTIQVMLPIPLPGTELTDRLRDQGRIFSTDYIDWSYYDGNFPVIEPDDPLTPEAMQGAVYRLMTRFYSLRHVVSIVLNILSVPLLVFWFGRIREGWRHTYRRWRNSIYRTIGWKVIHQWKLAFRKSEFPHQLMRAKYHLGIY